MPGVIAPKVHDFTVLFVEIHDFSVGSFLQLCEVPLNGSTTIWIVQSPQFIITIRFPDGALCPVSWAINDKAKQYWPSVRPEGTPLRTSPQLNFMSLITNLWAQQFVQFDVYPTACLFSPYFILSMRMWRETWDLSYPEINNTHCSSMKLVISFIRLLDWSGIANQWWLLSITFLKFLFLLLWRAQKGLWTSPA